MSLKTPYRTVFHATQGSYTSTSVHLYKCEFSDQHQMVAIEHNCSCCCTHSQQQRYLRRQITCCSSDCTSTIQSGILLTRILCAQVPDNFTRTHARSDRQWPVVPAAMSRCCKICSQSAGDKAQIHSYVYTRQCSRDAACIYQIDNSHAYGFLRLDKLSCIGSTKQ
jgi:hypothetical protein